MGTDWPGGVSPAPVGVVGQVADARSDTAGRARSSARRWPSPSPSASSCPSSGRPCSRPRSSVGEAGTGGKPGPGSNGEQRGGGGTKQHAGGFEPGTSSGAFLRRSKWTASKWTALYRRRNSGIRTKPTRPWLPGWTRTINRPINSRKLCQLSYRGPLPLNALAGRETLAYRGLQRQSGRPRQHRWASGRMAVMEGAVMEGAQ